MQTRMFLPASLAFAFLFAGCSTTPPTPPDTRSADAKAIRQVEADWLQALTAKNPDKFTAFYADDASLFMPGIPVVNGKADIAATWKKYFADRNFSGAFTTDKIVVAKSGDIAYTQGSYSVKYTDPKTKKVVAEKGKFVEVYKKQADHSWKAVADISNADATQAPMAKAAAPAPAQKRRR